MNTHSKKKKKSKLKKAPSKKPVKSAGPELGGVVFPKSSLDSPATQRMLMLVCNELKAEIRSLGGKTDGRFKDMDARFHNIDARFDHMDARFDQMDARFSRVEFLVEEQRSENRVVLEGLTLMIERMKRNERRLDVVEARGR